MHRSQALPVTVVGWTQEQAPVAGSQAVVSAPTGLQSQGVHGDAAVELVVPAEGVLPIPEAKLGAEVVGLDDGACVVLPDHQYPAEHRLQSTPSTWGEQDWQ